ncbi:hypothetical protein RU820_05465 [Acidithiobacillus ferrooxidans]|uniref:Uncharacterized protein n=1 Tax=Acidithiobacillus ferrooxidans (strain ATCC 23270 / DSM 14882 / CIP 104768 / NCIMB 8455) TaxID=243159 RepID=B7J898_ACIF2|nr:hypothetical protein [Acidithiobacillus ferrooxidans]ACK80449.1 hypothetical protein AFE_1150 [Acidithiobacillus ferrooxidans ATCC 23270]
MNSSSSSDIRKFLGGLKPGDSFQYLFRSMIGPSCVVTWKVTAVTDDRVICDSLEFGEHAFDMDGNGGNISISVENIDLTEIAKVIDAKAKARLVGSMRMVNWHDLPADFLAIIKRAVEDQFAKQKAEADIAGLQAKIQNLNDTLKEIGDFAHDHSTGPVVEDPLWEIRNMAYGGFVDICD